MPTLGLPKDPPLPAWPKGGRVGILDLEFTAWPGSWQRGWSGPDEWREVVQLGFLIVDGTSFTALGGGVEAMVRPLRNPVLSDYFTKLTGIGQARLDAEAVPLSAAVAALAAAGQADLIVFNGYDGEILAENCAIQGVTPPWPREQLFNFRPLLASSLNRPMSDLTSSELPRLAGIDLAGVAHTALDDCRAIAGAFASWRRAGLL